MRRQRLADHRGEIARGVRVAADRRGALRGVEGAAQRRARPAARRPRRRPAPRQACRLPESRRTARASASPAPRTRTTRRPPVRLSCAASSASRAGSAASAARVQIGDAKRVAQIGADRARHAVGALAHQAGIRAVQQHGADFRVGPPQKRGDPRRGEPHDRSARRFAGCSASAALHEQRQPSHDLLAAAPRRCAPRHRLRRRRSNTGSG